MAYGLSREDLKPNGQLHKRIAEALDKRWKASAQRIKRQHDKWRKCEDQYLAFLPETEVNAKRRAQRESGKPQYTTLVLPYSYAMLMTAWSYWTTVFLGRTPIFQYTGRHGESQQACQAVEALIDYQVTAGDMLIPLYFWLLDPGKFGVGLLGGFWDEEYTSVSQYVDTPQKFLGLWETGEVKRELVTTQVKGYCGNKLYNIRPYDWYPDPRVALWEIQKAEFHMFYRELGWNALVNGAMTGQYTNIDVLKSRKQKGEFGSTAREPGSPRVELPGDALFTVTDWDLQETGPYGIMECYIELIPNDWGLSPLKTPQKWCFTFTVTGNPSGTIAEGATGNVDLIIGGRPLGSFHNKFPLFFLECEPEAYAFASRSMLDVVRPLQEAMDWLFNAHMYNVRKVLNDQLVVDPSRIVMGDLLDPLPGGIIRAKEAGFGTDLSTAVRQLNVVDITRSHITDIEVIHQFAQRAVGITDTIMGLTQQGGRRSATEARGNATFGINRQKTTTEFMSAMGFTPLGSMLIAHSQQYYDAPKKFKIAGDLMLDAGAAFMMVDPEMIAGTFDFVPIDGTMPIDRYAQANLWRELMVGMRQVPELAMQFDISRIFMWVAQLAGLKNITRFKLEVQPDAALLQQVRMGNIIPFNGNQRRARGPGVSGATSPEPGQVAGNGTTG